MEWFVSLAHWFGSAVCHQWPDHSYFVAGVELPLCARCTGMYLGALLTIVYYSWRHPRAAGVPRAWALVLVILFSFAWAGDGVNSFLSTLGIFSLYPPQNILRLTTGALMGITLGTLITLMFNSLVWRSPTPTRLLDKPVDLLALLTLQGLLILTVNSQLPLLLYPLSLLSLLAILVLHAGLMGSMAASFARLFADNWRQAARPVAAGLGVALLYLDALALLRLLAGIWLGTPI